MSSSTVLANVHVQVPIGCLRSVTKSRARAFLYRGGRDEVKQVAKIFAQVCAQNYFGSRFTVLNQGQIPGPIPVPSPAGYWWDELCRSFRSTNLQPRLWYRRWPSHVCVKWVPWVFPPWVDSNSWVRQGPPSRACHSIRGQTENFSISRGNA